MNKAHEIETFKDMIEATTPETVNAFCEDLRLVLFSAHLAMAGSEKAKPEHFERFVWTDDGVSFASLQVGDKALTIKREEE